jgi:tRNA-specific 2-thiouridylase
VVKYFINSYKIGETPNPCVFCNSHVRWNSLFELAENLGASHIATGHYARIGRNPSGGVQLLRGVDENKDQSYVLHGLSQELLSRTIFPLGTFNKHEVRQLARKFKLPVAERPDSQDLCFVGQSGYRDFLKRYAPESVNPGPIKNKQGDILGQHKGLAFYTNGQRKGLGISGSKPFYVIEKIITDNSLVVGIKKELEQNEIFVDQINWISGVKPKKSFKASVKIRYKARDAYGIVHPKDGDRAQVKLDQPIAGVTPGQSLVVYQGEKCLGGGIIIKSQFFPMLGKKNV